MRLRIAAEGAVRENILYNEEPGGGARRLAGRRAAAGGTYARSRCHGLHVAWTVSLD